MRTHTSPSPRKVSFRRAYTIVEVALVLFLIGVLSATSVYMLGGSRVQGSDALAQTTADAAVDAALAVLQMEGTLQNTSVARLSIEQPDITFRASPAVSAGPSEASVLISDGVVAVAVLAEDGTCWMLRASLLGDSSQPLRRYAISPSGSRRDCSGARAYETSALASVQGRGEAWYSPLVWGDTSATVLAEAAVLLRARSFADGSQTMTNEGTSGPLLDATLGASTAVDNADPVFLPYEGTPYIYVPGRSGNVLSTANTTGNQITTNLDAAVRLELSSWSSGTHALIGKWQPGSNRGWMLAYDGAASRLVFWSSADGVTQSTSTASASFAPASGKAYWVRALKSGTSVTFYWAQDQVSEPTGWTQIGTPQTAPATMFASTLPLTVGGEAAGAGSSQMRGKLFDALVRSGSSGGVTARLAASSCTQSTCTGGNGETWTVTRAAGGLQTAVVTRPVLLFDSSRSSFLRIPTSTALGIPSSASLTVVLAARVHSSPQNSYLVARLDPSTATTAGWALRTTSTTNQTQTVASSGGATPAQATAVNTYTASASTTFVSRFEGVFGRVTSWHDTTKVTGSGISSPWPAITSSLPLVVGATATAGSPANGSDMEFFAVAVFARALTDTEVARVAAELAS